MQETVFWDLAPCIFGARSQKTVSCIVIAMETSNLTILLMLAFGIT
jgi:hypothetical protein